MRVRQIDVAHDWTFGKGQNNYLRDNNAVGQLINTRLSSFLGDCFFEMGAGIDWFNLLGNKAILNLNLAISSVILNTENVTGILQFSANLSPSRVYLVQYKVQTTFSTRSDTFVFNTIGAG